MTRSLSTEAGFASLGPYGQETAMMPRLDRALACASTTIGSLRQSSTRFSLTVPGGLVKWTYGVTDPIEIGRLLDLVRHFAGASWTPSRVELPGPPLAAKAAVESVFRCDLSRGEAATIIFPLVSSKRQIPVRRAGKKVMEPSFQTRETSWPVWSI